MDITLGTPALLFPALSLLMLAYTNRFLALASVIRALHASYQSTQEPRLVSQIASLRRRVRLVRDMQSVGALSILGCVLCMFALFLGWVTAGNLLFALSLLLLAISLILSLLEIHISVEALDLQLRDLEHAKPAHPAGPLDSP
jgi:hypothetical protein